MYQKLRPRRKKQVIYIYIYIYTLFMIIMHNLVQILSLRAVVNEYVEEVNNT